uniref:Uncharacterized protein n=1 Tax=Arundo donax TaxID=35708 RepID=A0A0A9CMG6_ARUDO
MRSGDLAEISGEGCVAARTSVVLAVPLRVLAFFPTGAYACLLRYVQRWRLASKGKILGTRSSD